MSYAIEQAEKEIASKIHDVNPRWYPRFHLAPRAGWMNDPNGLVWFDGWYHAFYQHHPYSTVWGPMHWGHARSKDMVHWEHLPIALAPEGPGDKDGCFSGSAVVDGDTLCLIYTGNKFHGEPIDDNLYQVQCLATSKDGIHFERHGVVLDTPPGIHHFRDPKVWKEGDTWFMVVGARDENDIGQVRLYRSADLREWEEAEAGVELAQATEGMGYMWECPDFFPLNDKHVLLFSPQGIDAKGYNYRNLYQSGYLVGNWAADKPFTIESQFVEIDHGHEFYAPQTFLAPDGRRIMIGWMAMWENVATEQHTDGWMSHLTLPRELTLGENNRIEIRPARELEACRTDMSRYEPEVIKDTRSMLTRGYQGTEVLLDWACAESDAEQYGLALGDGLRIYVDNQMQRLVLERSYPSTDAGDVTGHRSVPLTDGKPLQLRIFFDKSSVEVFVNDGEFCLSSRIYPNDPFAELSLFAINGSATPTQVTIWTLE